jgi:hypothetical protein
VVDRRVQFGRGARRPRYRKKGLRRQRRKKEDVERKKTGTVERVLEDHEKG